MAPSPPPPDAGRYLTIDELAARTGVSKSLLYKLKADGAIPFVQRCGGGKLFFPPDALGHATAEPSASEPSSPAPPAVTPKRLPGRRPGWDDGT